MNLFYKHHLLRIHVHFIILILLSSFFICSCAKKDKLAIQKSSPPKKVDLRLNFEEGDLTSFDPLEIASSTRGEAVGKWIFEGLTRLNQNGDYALAGASSFELSKCKTRYLFTLRANAYNNGSPVLAKDYERAWKRAIAPKSKCAKAHLFYCIKNALAAKEGVCSMDEVGVRALDQTTLLVELAYPTDYFFSLLAMPLFAPYKEKNSQVLFNGPFTLAHCEFGSVCTLKKNPFFWKKEAVALDTISIFSVQDNETSFHMYQNNEIDWIGNPFTTLSEEIIASQGDPNAKLRINRLPDRVYPFWIYLNATHPPLSSPLIRQALSCVIDRQKITEHIFFKRAPLFHHLPAKFSLIEQSLTDADLRMGRELFKQGLQELGMAADLFPPLTLNCCKLDNHKQLAEYLQEKWAEAFGIRIYIHAQDWSGFYHHLKQGNYHIAGAFFPGYYDSPLAYLKPLAEPTNFSKWHHKRYREVVDQLSQETLPKKRAMLIREAESILLEEMPFIPALNGDSYFSYPTSLKGVCFDFKGNPDFAFAYFETAQNESQSLRAGQ